MGDALPSLDDLNRQFFGDDAGPRPGRSAYAPLIAAGMVESRQGRNGGHFVISTDPVTATTSMSAVASSVDGLRKALDSLVATRWYVAELQDTRTGEWFGESLHPNRLAAETFALDILTRLGETPENVKSAAREAGWTCADTRGGGYGIRIYAVSFDGGSRSDSFGRRD